MWAAESPSGAMYICMLMYVIFMNRNKLKVKLRVDLDLRLLDAASARSLNFAYCVFYSVCWLVAVNRFVSSLQLTRRMVVKNEAETSNHEREVACREGRRCPDDTPSGPN
jgi:hypothetical protein